MSLNIPSDIPSDNRAMTSLNVSNNSLGVAAGWSFSSGQWYLNNGHPPGHSASHQCSRLPAAGSDVSGVILLADAIKNGALTSLNLSSNNLEGKGAMIVAEAIKVTHYAIAVVLVSFACPSDRWLYCCCLLLSTGQRGYDEPRSFKKRAQR
jgi:hypothetical protein